MAQKFNDIVKAFNQLIDSEYQWAVKERKDIYFDRWEYIIRDALAEIFTTDTAKGLRCLVTGEMNLLKRTINTISSIYNEQATRKLVINDELESEDGEVEEKTDSVYEELIKSVPFDLIMKKANQMTNLTNACAIRTVWREGKLDYDIMTFDSLQIITDPMDWKKIIGYCFYIGSTAPYFQEVRETNGNSIQVLPHRSHPGEQSPYVKFQSAVLYTSNNEFFDEKYRGKVIYFDQTRLKHLINQKMTLTGKHLFGKMLSLLLIGLWQ